jgi:hypothetical protein
MAYQVYFGTLVEENQALILTLLKLKEEANTLEPNEAELLYSMRGSSTPSSFPLVEEPGRQRLSGGGGGGGGGGRRSPRRGGSGRGRNNSGGSNGGPSNGGGGSSNGGDSN